MSRLAFKEDLFEDNKGQESADEGDCNQEGLGGKGSEQGAATSATNPNVSTWLHKFLSVKRQRGMIMEPPEFGGLDDHCLKAFHDSCRENKPSDPDTFERDDTESDSDELVEVQSELVSAHVNQDVEFDTVASESVEVEIAETGAMIRLFNLPYTITADDIKTFGRKFGVDIRSVELGEGKALGQASIEAVLLPEAASSSSCVESKSATICDLLREKSCCGRPIRVKDVSFEDKKRRASGNSRYFLEGLNYKCNNCSGVGHLSKECDKPVIPPPCHLCAGKDHESVDCPNIMCFRCGLFGHHLRDCSNPRMSRPIVCTICGSCTHELRSCCRYWPEQLLLSRDLTGRFNSAGRPIPNEDGLMVVFEKRLECSESRCMRCNRLGHTLCGSFNDGDGERNRKRRKGAEGRDGSEVYCPNCGELGHHVDIIRPNHYQLCTAPRYDAYQKFNALSRDLDDPYHGGLKGRNQDRFYERLISNMDNGLSFGANSYESLLQLFPSLAPAPQQLSFTSSNRTSMVRYR